MIVEEETPKDIEKRERLARDYEALELHLTAEQQDFMATKFSSKLWRLSNLYTIQDKDGKQSIMRLNTSQLKVLTKYKHNRKAILKSRQQGISTLFLAYYLDSCLTKPGYQAGIQSYGQDEAEKLSKRALLMWEELEKDIKDMLGLTLVSSNSKGMTFSNGSILKIGNFRGDTLQALHVSELGKIARKYPEKAKELKTGAFQAVSVNNKITIESTAEGRAGLFYEIWNKAILRQASTQELTPLDFQPIFLSWLEDPDCQLFVEYPMSVCTKEYIYGKYEETGELKTIGLEEELNIKLTQYQIWWLSAKMDELGDDFNQEYPSTPEKAFDANIEGMYFKTQYQRLLKSKRIKNLFYNPAYKVDVSFDLGMNDEMVLLFSQTIDQVPYIVDEYHNSGEGLEFYIEILKLKEYYGNYGILILPHDAKVRDMSTGRTRIEVFTRHGFYNIKLLKRLSFQDSLEAARQLIDIAVFGDSCVNILLCLQNYRKKYDKLIGAYLATDIHDIHSNYAASLRYLAQGLNHYRVRNTKQTTMEQKYVAYLTNKPSDGFAI